ncbi:MAG: PEGA domain-containing protein [Patescibacteria group bacterium]|jgi:hypothetical protein|nr:PEGA domain-containing protein [Patescibacteria group bacterium]
MKLKYRRLIYLSFIAAFLIIAPIISLYASGFKYNFKTGRLEKTGIIYIDSKPKGSEIYINNEPAGKTPKRFSRMLPESYQITVQKQGYYSWQKELEVQSGLTTFAKNIILFKQTLPISLVEGQIIIFEISPNKEKIFYSLDKAEMAELRLLNIKTGDDFLVAVLDKKTYNQLEFIEWSPSQQKIVIRQLVGDFNKYLIFDVDTLKTKDLFDITSLNFDKISWDKTNDAFLYGRRQEVLYQINLAENNTSPILSANITDFAVTNDQIFYINELANEMFLNRTTIQGREATEPQKIKLPAPSKFNIQVGNNNFLVLLDQKTNDLFIVKSSAFETQDISQEIILQDRAKKIIWNKNKNRLLYYTDFEIWTFNPETGQKDLITRYGSAIDNAIWLPGNSYLIYQTENEIRIIELWVDEVKNDLQLTQTNTISNIATDDTGSNIYFNGVIGSKTGIFKLEIQ